MSRIIQYFVPKINKHLNTTGGFIDTTIYTPSQMIESPFLSPLARPKKKGPSLTDRGVECKKSRHYQAFFHHIPGTVGSL